MPTGMSGMTQWCWSAARKPERIDEAWLRTTRWIVREQGSGTRSTFEDVLRTRGFDPATDDSDDAAVPTRRCAPPLRPAGVAVLSRLVVRARAQGWRSRRGCRSGCPTAPFTRCATRNAIAPARADALTDLIKEQVA